jgi:hypothetical protein
MNDPWVSSTEKQMDAAMQALGQAIQNCPDELWEARIWIDREHPDSRWTCFWSIAFHTLFFLDLYLEGSLTGFTPPRPFTLEELDPNGAISPRVYPREELQIYLEHCMRKNRQIIETMTEEKARRMCEFKWMTMSYAELQLDNLRHVQEHAAQLNLFLGQQAGIHSRWLSTTKEV